MSLPLIAAILLTLTGLLTLWRRPNGRFWWLAPLALLTAGALWWARYFELIR